jgi:hypothetical protein
MQIVFILGALLTEYGPPEPVFLLAFIPLLALFIYIIRKAKRYQKVSVNTDSGHENDSEYFQEKDVLGLSKPFTINQAEQNTTLGITKPGLILTSLTLTLLLLLSFVIITRTGPEKKALNNYYWPHFNSTIQQTDTSKRNDYPFKTCY